MSTETAIPTELINELQDRLGRAAKGIRDPDEMGRAFEEMKRMREELRLRIGTVDVAVDLVRDARNQ